MAKQKPITTDPNAIYQQLAAMPQGGATPLDQTYSDALSRYRKASDATYVLPDVLKSYLGGVSPAYTQDKAAVLAQFADKNSPLYISNPFARLQAAQAATQGQQQTYSQVLDRVNRLVGLGVSQQQQNVSDLGNQVEKAQQAQKDARAALQQQFNNALNLAQEARARASAGGDNPDKLLTPSQVIALNNAGIQAKLGQRMSDLFGQQPRDNSQGTKNFNDFSKDFSIISGNRAPTVGAAPDTKRAYQEYLQAQQRINAGSSTLEQESKNSPLIGPLLKPKTLTLENLFANQLGNTQQPTGQEDDPLGFNKWLNNQ